jgi:hypothetical protein
MLDFIAAVCCLSHNMVVSRVIDVLCLSLAVVLQNCDFMVCISCAFAHNTWTFFGPYNLNIDSDIIENLLFSHSIVTYIASD